jgi:spore maturation protein CgeB
MKVRQDQYVAESAFDTEQMAPVSVPIHGALAPATSARERVLVLGRFGVESFESHIAETFAEMGHSTAVLHLGESDLRLPGVFGRRVQQALQLVDEVSEGVPVFRRRQTRKIVASARQHAAELVVVGHDFLQPAQVAALKEATGAKVALWFPDHIARFGRAYFLHAAYDTLFFKDTYIVRVLRGEYGLPAFYLPQCCNPARHALPADQAVDPRFRCDIATAGHAHTARMALFRHLTDFDVHIWGNPPPLWMDTHKVAPMLQGRFVADQEKALVFRSASIALNTQYPSEICGVNKRTFEIAAAGGFQLVTHRPGLEELFDDGRELVSYEGLDDMLEKIRYYLVHDELRQQIARAGRERALAQHTYALRLQLILDTVNGLATGYPSAHLSSGPLRTAGGSL